MLHFPENNELDTPTYFTQTSVNPKVMSFVLHR